MNGYVNYKIRIKREVSHDVHTKKLLKANLFESYRDVLMAAAVIGYLKSFNNKLDKVEKSAETILMQFFTDNDFKIFDLLAYANTSKQSIINEDEKYEIFSSYAKVGFPYLLEALEIDLSEIDKLSPKELALKYYNILLYPEELTETNISDEDLIG